jgi:polysaccharide deacetylase 2 family uncharacterized protein YibQ
MKKSGSSSIGVLLVIIAVAVFLFYRFIYQPGAEKKPHPKIEKTPAAQQAPDESRAQAEKFFIKEIILDPALIISKSSAEVLEITARMPERYNEASLKAEFEKFSATRKAISATYSSVKTDVSETFTAEIASQSLKVAKLSLVRNTKPKIAIILDDWGYGPKNLPYLKSIKQNFTIAVLPGHNYSVKAAEEAHMNGKGVMLHLPMQPEGKVPLEKDTIMADMSRDQIVNMVDRLAGEIPYFNGVNNHMGSLVTEKKDVMVTILDVLKERNYFFVDSLTSAKTVAYKTALEEGVHAGKRNVFIDNKKESSYNEAQINQLEKLAKKQGWAIGIGHDDPVTLKTLSRMMPQLEAKGFEFVYVAELLQ